MDGTGVVYIFYTPDLSHLPCLRMKNMGIKQVVIGHS